MRDPELYSALVQLLTGAEATRWNRFYNYLTANSLLVLAWATLYDVPLNTPKTAVLVAISVIGSAGGLAWAMLGYRSTRFHDAYMRLGKHMEMQTVGGVANRQCAPLSVSLQIRDSAPFGFLGSSYYILTVGPLVLAGLYVLLLAASCGAEQPWAYLVIGALTTIICALAVWLLREPAKSGAWHARLRRRTIEGLCKWLKVSGDRFRCSSCGAPLLENPPLCP
jgi:hypothetical protein